MNITTIEMLSFNICEGIQDAPWGETSELCLDLVDLQKITENIATETQQSLPTQNKLKIHIMDLFQLTHQW